VDGGNKKCLRNFGGQYTFKAENEMDDIDMNFRGRSENGTAQEPIFYRKYTRDIKVLVCATFV
jgi:hypothetical protein